MGKFIYVFNAAARDKLAQAGFLLLKEDEWNSIYVFTVGDTMNFSDVLSEVSYIESDTLTF